jgi:hypothetical protein
MLATWSDIASIVAAVIGIVGLPLLLWQLFVARSQRQDAIRLSTAQVLLAADAVLATHSEVHAKLRPDGEWTGANASGRPKDEEFPLVEPYLGVFERLFVAWQAGQVEAKTLDDLYGYRLDNIWKNKRIVETKLQNERLKTRWSGIIGLTCVLEAQRGRPIPGHTDKWRPEELLEPRSARRLKALEVKQQRSRRALALLRNADQRP